MFAKVCILSLLASIAVATPVADAFQPRLDGRIVGGQDVDIRDYPYQVSLCYNGGHICGAVLISERFALTAGHCTDGLPNPEFMTLRVGQTKINTGQELNISKTYTNPDYNGMYIDYDITVLELAEDVQFGYGIEPIPLVNENEIIPEGTEAVVSGWGTLTENGSFLAQTLQAVKVKMVSNANCAKSYNGITDRMVCAGVPEGGKDACQGDSGGPIVVGGRLVGLVSWGFGCARPGYPGVYSSVASMRLWIGQATGV